jgi:benzoyl-CoA reductase subunit A
MKHEYSKWPESTWTSSELNPKSAERITAGVDIGTTSVQAAIFCDGSLFGYSSICARRDFSAAAETALQNAIGDSGMKVSDMDAVAATGFGKRNAGFASKEIDEIHCHAKGARHIYGPEVRTVVDLGGQTCKAILLHGWDRVKDFAVNDKCATGMGRNIEIVSDLLMTPITEIGEKSLNIENEPEPVSTTCYAFAQTEAMGLFRPVFREEPFTENEVYASYIFAVAWRILGVIGKLQSLDAGDVTVSPGLGFTGGLAKNPGVTVRLEQALGVKALACDTDPMLAGAIGAALLA